MEGALDIVALHKTLAQLGITVTAVVVDSKHAIVHFKNCNVLILRSDRNASKLKLIANFIL